MGTVLRGVGLSGGGYALAQAMNLVAYIILARLLSPDEIGIYAAATVLIAFSLLVTEAGFTSAVVQRRDRFEEAANTALLATFANGFLFALLALATAPLLGLFFDSDEVTAIAAAMAGMVFLRITSSVPDAILQRRFSFLRRLVIEPAQVLAFATAAIIAASNDMGAWSLVIGQYAGTTVDVILCWALVRWRPHPRLATMRMWRELVGFGRHVFLATTILRAGEQADGLIVGRILGTAALGQFRYAFRLASAPFLMLLAAASYVLFPAFSRIAHDRERHQAAFLRSLKWMCLLAFPAGLIMIPFGVPLAVTLFGEVWEDAGYAAMAMSGYTVGLIISSVVSESLKADGRPDRLVLMHTITAVATAGSMLALTGGGLVAAAAGLSIGALAAAVWAVRVAHRTLGVELGPMLRAIIPPAIAAVVMAGAILCLELLVFDAESYETVATLALLTVEAGLAAVIYLVTLRIVGPDSFAEVRWGAGEVARRFGRT